MALKKSFETVHGFNAVDAYHRVEDVRLIGKTELSFRIRSYQSIDKPFFEENLIQCGYDIEGLNPIAQAYEHLKTLPEFSDAVDC